MGNKNISLGISFKHYFVKDKYFVFSSSVQNDLFTSFRYKKTWLQPAIALGYSSGEFGPVLMDYFVHSTYTKNTTTIFMLNVDYTF